MINKKIWNINLPVLKSAFVTNISPKQYDTASNLFKIALYKDMEKYDLTGLTVQAVFKKADGTISYLPCTITNAASGELEIDITSQVLAIAAEVECEIRITGTEGELLIAPKFYFKVYESLNIDGAVESQDEFPVLVELLNRVETVETELQNITPEQIAQVTTNEQTRQDNEAARQLAEAERAGFYAGFNSQLAEIEQKVDVDIPAQLNEKVQNFKLKNEVVNGDFSQGTTGWASDGGSNTVLNNTLVNTANDITPNPLIKSQLYIYDSGNKYYARIKAKVTNNVCTNILLKLIGSGNDVFVNNKSNPTQDTEYVLSGVGTATASGPGRLYIYHQYTTPAIANGKVLNLKDVSMVNLTNVFGAGNEPTKEEMDRLVEMVPNQWWDGELDLTQQQYVNWLLSFIREKANKVQEAWITPTLLNGATQHASRPLQYRKTSYGTLQLRGETANTPANNTIIFQLSVGYRPPRNINTVASRGNAISILSASTDGLVSASGASVTFFIYDGVEIPLE